MATTSRASAPKTFAQARPLLERWADAWSDWGQKVRRDLITLELIQLFGLTFNQARSQAKRIQKGKQGAAVAWIAKKKNLTKKGVRAQLKKMLGDPGDPPERPWGK